jgi:hypothetical protein
MRFGWGKINPYNFPDETDHERDVASIDDMQQKRAADNTPAMHAGISQLQKQERMQGSDHGN